MTIYDRKFFIEKYKQVIEKENNERENDNSRVGWGNVPQDINKR